MQLIAFILIAPWLSTTATYDDVFASQPRLVDKTWYGGLVPLPVIMIQILYSAGSLYCMYCSEDTTAAIDVHIVRLLGHIREAG